MIERMVLFEASGDLTGRLLLPAVAQLAEAELLADLDLVGSDITDWFFWESALAATCAS